MKRGIIFLVILAIICAVSPALAEPDYKSLVEDINIFADIYRAPRFEVDSAVDESDGDGWLLRMPSTDPCIDLILTSKNGESIASLLCVCTDESHMLDYLASCCAVISEYGKSLGITDSFGYLLHNYMMSRAEEDPTPLIAKDGTICMLSKKDGLYTLTIIPPS